MYRVYRVIEDAKGKPDRVEEVGSFKFLSAARSAIAALSDANQAGGVFIQYPPSGDSVTVTNRHARGGFLIQAHQAVMRRRDWNGSLRP